MPSRRVRQVSGDASAGMSLSLFDDIAPEATRLRLRTLIRLRWIAVVGQSAAVLFVYAVLGYELPLALCFLVIALSAWLNIFLRLRFPAGEELSAPLATGQLAYDVLQLSALLALTGGLANPFSVLLLVPAVVSASALPILNTALLAILTLAAATVIAFANLPLPWPGGGGAELPGLYIAGIWTALASALVFMSLYAFRVAEEARQMSEALSAAELVLAREQHLTAIDGLAAAAAHELGTPLATIALVARELERDASRDSPHAEDIRLLRSQVERCRGILERIGSLGSTPEGPLARVSLTSLVEETAAPHREFGIKVRIAAEGEPPEPVGPRNPAILYGIGNLVENAVDYAKKEVAVTARWNSDQVSIEIADDGPGFPSEILAQVGEPYLTTSRRKRRGGPESGLGLGLFIAKTLLQRTGATLTISNRDTGGRGAVAQVTWPRRLFERVSEGEILAEAGGDAMTLQKDNSAAAQAPQETT
jgi:two-component system, sensor histidine kinase RegB